MPDSATRHLGFIKSSKVLTLTCFRAKAETGAITYKMKNSANPEHIMFYYCTLKINFGQLILHLH